MATVSGFTAERMLEVENSTVVDADVVGDNLILHTRGGDDIDAGNVKGSQGTPGNPFGNIVELGASVDLNTLITSGYYTQAQNADATSGTNYPVLQAGLLEVIAEGTGLMVWQRFTVYNGGPYAGSVWSRTKYTTNWSPWVRISPDDTGWVDLTVNSPYAPQNVAQRPMVRRIGGMVYTRGGINNAGLSINAAFGAVITIPVGFRPSADNNSQVYSAGSSAGAATAHWFVNPTGSVDIRTGGTLGGYYFFSGAVWSVD